MNFMNERCTSPSTSRRAVRVKISLGTLALSVLFSLACEPANEEGVDFGEPIPIGGQGGAGSQQTGTLRNSTALASVTGAWPNGSLGTASFSSERGQDVECVWDQHSATPELRLSAGDSGGEPDVRVILRGVSDQGTGTTSLSADVDKALEATFRFHDDTTSVEYEYASAGDTITTCSWKLDTFDQIQLTGHLACRDLIATPESDDYVSSEIAVTASATLSFDCPLHILESPSVSTGGGDGSGGESNTGGLSSSGGSPATGGASSGGGSCRGVATSCSILSTSECSSALGCRRDGECTGLSRSCYYYLEGSSCYSQDGCYWLSSSGCGGSSRSCSRYSTSTSCILQDGCSWDDTCEGVATPCSGLTSEFSCSSQPGCYWSTL